MLVPLESSCLNLVHRGLKFKLLYKMPNLVPSTLHYVG